MIKVSNAGLAFGHRTTQSGMVLVIIVIVGILVAFTAFSAIRNSNIELKIATGYKIRSESFNKLELIVSEAENSVKGLTQDQQRNMFPEANTFINQADNEYVDRSINWNDSSLGIQTSAHESVGTDGQYFVKYLGKRIPKNEAQNDTGAGESTTYHIHYYLITARYTDPITEAVRQIETVYSTEANLDE